MTTTTVHGTWVWDVVATGRAGLQGFLDKGWEPFGVTVNVHSEYIYHLRRKRKVK